MAQEDYCCLEKEAFSDWPLFPNGGDNCNVYVVAQSFTPQEDYVLCKVRVVLQTTGGASATLYVQDNSSATPTTIYTQATSSPIAGARWYEFDVPDVGLTAGTTYYIRVTGNVLWRNYDGDPYTFGMAFRNAAPITFRDQWFITYTYAVETKVEMGFINAEDFDGYVDVKWTTETEIDNAGFNVRRSLSKDGPFAQINDQLIPAEGAELKGSAYTFVDMNVVNGLTYYYQIESVDLSSKAIIHGPVSATADAEKSRIRASAKASAGRPSLPG